MMAVKHFKMTTTTVKLSEITATASMRRLTYAHAQEEYKQTKDDLFARFGPNHT